MSNLELILRLCRLLDGAQEIIKRQAEIMAMHGIDFEDGSEIKAGRERLLEDIERSI